MKLKHLFSVLCLLVAFSFVSHASPVDDVGDPIEMVYKQIHSDFVADVAPVAEVNNFVIQKDPMILSTIQTTNVEIQIASSSKETSKPIRIQRTRANLNKENFSRTDHAK